MQLQVRRLRPGTQPGEIPLDCVCTRLPAARASATPTPAQRTPTDNRTFPVASLQYKHGHDDGQYLSDVPGIRLTLLALRRCSTMPQCGAERSAHARNRTKPTGAAALQLRPYVVDSAKTTVKVKTGACGGSPPIIRDSAHPLHCLSDFHFCE